MKKILLFLFLPLFFIACSSDEPVIDESELVESSDSETEVIGCFTLTFTPYSKLMEREQWADIICKFNIDYKENYFALPYWLFVEVKDREGVYAALSKNYTNIPKLYEFDKVTYGTSSYLFKLYEISFLDVERITLVYSYNDNGEIKQGCYVVYGDGKKCNKILRSYFK